MYMGRSHDAGRSVVEQSLRRSAIRNMAMGPQMGRERKVKSIYLLGTARSPIADGGET